MYQHHLTVLSAKKAVVRMFFFLTLVSAPFALSARIIYVHANASGSGTGQRWTDAYRSLGDALAATVPGDTVWVAGGVYYPVMTGSAVTDADRLKAFFLPEGVEVYGGFPATGNPDMNARDPLVHRSVLSGDISRNETRDAHGIIPDGTVLSDNSYHVVVINNRDSSCVVDGFYINGGQAKHTAAEHNGIWTNSGAGMFINRGSPVLRNLVFTGNQALEGDGGGLWSGNAGCNPSLHNVVFTHNRASNGGGMYQYSGAPVLDSVSFLNNEAVNSGNIPGSGGGLYAEESGLRMSGALLMANRAAYGAGAYLAGGNPAITHSVFRSNIAFLYDPGEQSNRGGGGGVYTTGGTPLYSMLVFDRNTAAYAGGMYSENGSPEITNVVFTANEADNYGGGFYITSYDPGSDPKVAGLVFAGNRGSGMHNRTDGFTLIQCTFYGNESCGLRNWDERLEVENCIFWDNTVEIEGPGASQKVTGSLIKGSGGSSGWNSQMGTDGGGNLDTDPLFVNPAASDLALQEQSPARDAGVDSLVPGFLKTDVAGRQRISGPGVDMGAYEYYRSVNNLVLRTPEQTSLSVYPNPATGICHVRTPSPSAVLVYDAGGRIVLNGHSGSPLDISRIPDGVYLIVATDPSRPAVYTGRFVKGKG